MSALIAECIADKLDGGMSVCEVFDTYGYGYDAVRRMYESVRGVDMLKTSTPRYRNTKRFTDAVSGYAAAMWSQGATAQEIADVVGVKLHTVYVHMTRHRDAFPYRCDTGKARP